MCEYCRETGKREEILEDEELSVKIKKQRILGYSIKVELKNHEKYSAISTSINYCPMCRQKIK